MSPLSQIRNEVDDIQWQLFRKRIRMGWEWDVYTKKFKGYEVCGLQCPHCQKTLLGRCPLHD